MVRVTAMMLTVALLTTVIAAVVVLQSINRSHYRCGYVWGAFDTAEKIQPGIVRKPVYCERS